MDMDVIGPTLRIYHVAPFHYCAKFLSDTPIALRFENKSMKQYWGLGA